MEEKQNWLAMGAVVLVVAGLGIFLYRQSRQAQPEIQLPSEDQTAQQRADELLESLDITIPDDATRVNLRDVTGGSAAGIATRTETGEETSQSVLVALPEPIEGEFYEAYLVNPQDESADPVYLGKLRSIKGGWTLDYNLSEDQSMFNTIRITKEKMDDKQPEETILEGEFEVSDEDTQE